MPPPTQPRTPQHRTSGGLRVFNRFAEDERPKTTPQPRTQRRSRTPATPSFDAHADVMYASLFAVPSPPGPGSSPVAQRFGATPNVPPAWLVVHSPRRTSVPGAATSPALTAPPNSPPARHASGGHRGSVSLPASPRPYHKLPPLASGYLKTDERPDAVVFGERADAFYRQTLQLSVQPKESPICHLVDVILRKVKRLTPGHENDALSMLTRKEFQRWAVNALSAKDGQVPDIWCKDRQVGETEE